MYIYVFRHTLIYMFIYCPIAIPIRTVGLSLTSRAAPTRATPKVPRSAASPSPSRPALVGGGIPVDGGRAFAVALDGAALGLRP